MNSGVLGQRAKCLVLDLVKGHKAAGDQISCSSEELGTLTEGAGLASRLHDLVNHQSVVSV
jgi:hypothetical protein